MKYKYIYDCVKGLPQWLSDKEWACKAGDASSIPGLGRSPRVGYGNPLQYSCLENLTDRGPWRATVHGLAKSQTQLKQLSTHAGLFLGLKTFILK